jgi:hypothetical protein
VVRLACPLCGTVVADGPGEPVPGACPGCGAHFAGGGDSPPEAAAAALAEWGLPGGEARGAIAPEALARGLFALGPGDPLAARAAINSDRRDGFYRWWLFVRAEGDARREVLARVAGA